MNQSDFALVIVARVCELERRLDAIEPQFARLIELVDLLSDAVSKIERRRS